MRHRATLPEADLDVAVRPGPPLEEVDPEVHAAIRDEARRQSSVLGLIASENHVSRAVLEAEATVLTNKYAEGYPGRRYYGGCQFVDVVEDLARRRAVELFGADHANVQPHAGAPANLAVYFAFARPGDTLLGMRLDHGGHLTHGSPVNLSGAWFRFVHYGVNRETERVDYAEVRRLAREHRPRIIIAGHSAYPRHLDFGAFREIADEVGALLLVDMAHFAGLVAAGVHPSPVPHADVVTTTTHKTLRGPRGAIILCRSEHAAAIDKAVFPGLQGGPLMHVIAAKAVCLKEAMTPEFRAYQRQILRNAARLAEGLARRGFRLVSGGTDNHLMLVDLGNRGLTGRQAETALDRVGIIVNKNMIPFDPEKPWVTSGIRIGTPAVTTRGMGEAEMDLIAGLIDRTLADAAGPGDPGVRAGIAGQVQELCRSFPIPG